MSNSDTVVKMKVFGVGGGGNNTVDHLKTIGIDGKVITYALNTDAQALKNSKADFKIKLGEELTQGLGAGSLPSVGAEAARESRQLIEGHLDDTDILFIAAGMGGGTGTGAAPEIANYAREKGLLTIAVVTTPFTFEGTNRMRSAIGGVKALEETCDVCLVISNQNLIHNHSDVFVEDAFELPDNVLKTAILAFISVLTNSTTYGKDISYNQLKGMLTNAGLAVISIESSGKELPDDHKDAINADLDRKEAAGEFVDRERAIRAREIEFNLAKAIEKAVLSEMLDVSVRGAKSIILSIGYPEGTTRDNMQAHPHRIIRKLFNYTPEEYTNINVTVTPYYHNKGTKEVEVTLIATGFEDDKTVDRVIKNKEEEIENSDILGV